MTLMKQLNLTKGGFWRKMCWVGSVWLVKRNPSFCERVVWTVERGGMKKRVRVGTSYIGGKLFGLRGWGPFGIHLCAIVIGAW